MFPDFILLLCSLVSNSQRVFGLTLLVEGDVMVPSLMEIPRLCKSGSTVSFEMDVKDVLDIQDDDEVVFMKKDDVMDKIEVVGRSPAEKDVVMVNKNKGDNKESHEKPPEKSLLHQDDNMMEGEKIDFVEKIEAPSAQKEVVMVKKNKGDKKESHEEPPEKKLLYQDVVMVKKIEGDKKKSQEPPPKMSLLEELTRMRWESIKDTKENVVRQWQEQYDKFIAMNKKKEREKKETEGKTGADEEKGNGQEGPAAEKEENVAEENAKGTEDVEKESDMKFYD